MTAQDVIDQVAIDMRNVLDASGNSGIMLNWVDRTHKDVLHTSIFAPFNYALTTVSTTKGQSAYTLTVTPRRIITCFDRTTNRLLLPATAIPEPGLPVSETRETREHPPGVAAVNVMQQRELHRKTQTPLSQYYLLVGTQLIVFPAPVYAITLEVTYEQTVSTLASNTTTLTVPDDGIDVMVAGCDFLAAQYLKRGQEAQLWAQVYTTLKRATALV